jgi:lipopolysaccharide/colanic/teichoic acid biosynthesis glycosyltransferase
LKRGVDIVGAGAGLLCLSPVLTGITILEFKYHGWPPLFVQTRPGRHGELFDMYKFRSMTNKTDADGNLLPDEQRLTKFGQFLRSTSLDELPELINVLKGDMSLVGPRPLLTQYLERYSDEQARRHEVKPGITGWAQVNGRNALSWAEKFRLDVWYVDNQSLALDLKILARTVLSVLQREGISAAGEATMPEFMGNQRGKPTDVAE